MGPGDEIGTTASRPGGTRSRRPADVHARPSGPPTRFYFEATDKFPFFKPGVDFVSSFILERPRTSSSATPATTCRERRVARR